MTVSSLPLVIWALIMAARLMRSTRSVPAASSPAPSTMMAPVWTAKSLRLPALSSRGVPVVRTTRPALMNLAPLTVMPLALARTNAALWPAISVAPLKALAPLPVTWKRMTRAGPLVRLALPATLPPASWDAASVAELTRTRPLAPTLNWATLLLETPAALVLAML